MTRSGSETGTPALITKTDAARLLGVSRDTISRLVRRGVLREVRLSDGMFPWLRRDDVIALVRKGDEP
jgi:excisionase family DNA binding protein